MGHQGLSLTDPTSSVCSRPIDLGEILSRESTPTVGSPSSVGVNDDFATGQTSITLRSTNNETTSRVDLELHEMMAEGTTENANVVDSVLVK